jgi:hypothetical protein
MDKAYSSRTPMVVRALEMDKDLFRLKEEGEEVSGQEYPYPIPNMQGLKG